MDLTKKFFNPKSKDKKGKLFSNSLYCNINIHSNKIQYYNTIKNHLIKCNNYNIHSTI